MLLSISVVLKSSKKKFEAKNSFIVHWKAKKDDNKEYEYIVKVWDKFGTKTIKGYYNCYLKCDVLLLANVFGKYINSSLKNNGLCPSHYLSEPGLTWDAILSMTKVKTELISDADMYLFFEKNMRGGVSYISIRYSEANNKHLLSYDSKQESKHNHILRRKQLIWKCEV